jgi:rubrerythrin
MRNLADLLEVGVRMERLQVETYRRWASLAANPSLADLCQALAAEEERHLGFFRQVLADIADYNPRYEYPGEYEHHLQGTAWRALGWEGMLRVEDPAGDGEILARGVLLEEKSLEFYRTSLGMPAGPEAEGLRRIILEEERHLVRLRDLARGIRP